MRKSSMTLEKTKTEIKPVYGGEKIIITFHVSHMLENITPGGAISNIDNSYTVEAELRGLNELTPELYFCSVTETHENNEETLIQESLLELLNDCNASQLMGMEEL